MLGEIKKWNQLKTWGLSATLGNLETALSTLIGNHKNSFVNGDLKKKFVVNNHLKTEKFHGLGIWGCLLKKC